MNDPGSSVRSLYQPCALYCPLMAASHLSIVGIFPGSLFQFISPGPRGLHPTEMRLSSQLHFGRDPRVLTWLSKDGESVIEPDLFQFSSLNTPPTALTFFYKTGLNCLVFRPNWGPSHYHGATKLPGCCKSTHFIIAAALGCWCGE